MDGFAAVSLIYTGTQRGRHGICDHHFVGVISGFHYMELDRSS